MDILEWIILPIWGEILPRGRTSRAGDTQLPFPEGTLAIVFTRSNEH